MVGANACLAFSLEARRPSSPLSPPLLQRSPDVDLFPSNLHCRSKPPEIHFYNALHYQSGASTFPDDADDDIDLELYLRLHSPALPDFPDGHLRESLTSFFDGFTYHNPINSYQDGDVSSEEEYSDGDSEAGDPCFELPSSRPHLRKKLIPIRYDNREEVLDRIRTLLRNKPVGSPIYIGRRETRTKVSYPYVSGCDDNVEFVLFDLFDIPRYIPIRYRLTKGQRKALQPKPCIVDFGYDLYHKCNPIVLEEVSDDDVFVNETLYYGISSDVSYYPFRTHAEPTDVVTILSDSFQALHDLNENDSQILEWKQIVRAALNSGSVIDFQLLGTPDQDKLFRTISSLSKHKGIFFSNLNVSGKCSLCRELNEEWLSVTRPPVSFLQYERDEFVKCEDPRYKRQEELPQTPNLSQMTRGIIEQFEYMSPFFFLLYDVRKMRADCTAFDVGVAITRFFLSIKDKYPRSIDYITSIISTFYDEICENLSLLFFEPQAIPEDDIQSGFQSLEFTPMGFMGLLNSFSLKCVGPVVFTVSLLGTILYNLSAGRFPDLNDVSKFARGQMYDAHSVVRSFNTTADLLIWAFTGVYDYIYSFIDPEHVSYLGSDPVKSCYSLGQQILCSPPPASIGHHREVFEYGDLCDRYMTLYKRVKQHSLASHAVCSFYNIGDLDKYHAKVAEKCNAYGLMLRSASYRKVPYCVMYYGGTSLGKTSVTYLTAQLICRWKDLPDDKRFFYNLEPGCKHWDNFTASKVVLIVDDVGSLRSEKAAPGGDPQIVHSMKILNNAAFQPPQAALADKGNTPFNAPIVIMTSNVKDIKAGEYMTYAETVLRRIRHTVTLTVAPDYSANGVLDTDKAAAWSCDHPHEFPPFWLFTVEKYVATNSYTSTALHINGKFQVIEFEGIVMRNVSASVYLKWLKYDVDRQDREQNTSVALSESRLTCCGACEMPISCCSCMEIDGDSLQSVEFPISLRYAALPVCCFFLFYFFRWLYLQIRILRCWIAYKYDTLCDALGYYKRSLDNLAFATTVLGRLEEPIVQISNASSIISRHETPINEAVNIAHGINKGISFAKSAVLNNPSTCALGALATFILMLRIFRSTQPIYQPHGNTSSTSPDPDFASDFSVKSSNVQPSDVKSYGEGMPPAFYNASNTFLSDASKTSSGAENNRKVIDHFSKGIGRIRLRSTSNTLATCVVLGGGFLLVNHHTVIKHLNERDITIALYFSRCDNIDSTVLSTPTSGFLGSISSRQIFSIPEKDVAIIYIPNFNRNGLLQYFVLNKHFSASSDPSLLTRSKICVFESKKVKGSTALRASVHLAYDGMVVANAIVYNLEVGETVKGESGSVYCIHLGNTLNGSFGALALAGIHCAGQDGNSVAIPIDQSDLRAWTQCCIRKFENLGSEFQADYTAAQLASTVVSRSDNIFMLKEAGVTDLSPTHRKSCFSWMTYPHTTFMEIYGHMNVYRSSQGLSSKFRLTPWSSFMDRLSTHPVLGSISNIYAPAVCIAQDLWKVHRRAAEASLTEDLPIIPQRILDFAATSYLSDVAARSSPSTYSVIIPFSIHEAINGNAAFGSLDFSTGAGFGYSKKKHHYFTLNNHANGQYRVPHEELCYQVNEMEKMLRMGIDPNAVFSAHIKSEIRTSEKVQDHKIRVMNGSPLPYTILMRRYLIGIVVFMMRNQLATECMVGMNVESMQMTTLARHLQSKGGTSRFIDGDYTDFDKKQKFNVSSTAADVMYAMILRFGPKDLWKPEDLLAARTLLTALCHPSIDFFATLVTALGTNPSGHSLTVQKNCIVNSLYMRCVFIVLWAQNTSVPMQVTAYSDNVSQGNYGDDVVSGISENTPWFNHRTIRDTLALWSIPYTRADKSQITDQNLYTPFSEISFLKRKWEWDGEFGAYRAPIECASIVRGLHYFERSSLSDAEHLVVLLQAMSQLALSLGRLKYNSIVDFLKELSTFIPDGFGDNLNFINYDEYIDRFHANSVTITLREEDSQCINQGITVPIRDGKIRCVNNSYLSQRNEIQTVEREDYLQRGLGAIVFCAHSGFQNSRRRGRLRVSNRPAQTIINFLDAQEGQRINAPSIEDPTFDTNHDHSTEYSDFFRRPIKLATYSWYENGALDSSINPWYEYLYHPQVAKKVSGFSRFRGKMCLKLVINASPFQYSLGIMAYKPLPALSGGMCTATSLTGPEFMALTQYPHAFFWPQASQGCVMELPFLYHSDWLTLDPTGVHATDMGTAYIKGMTILRNASGTPSANAVNVSLYGWMEDVQLSGPSLLYQADEYGKQPVSTTASAVSSVASQLVRIPYIGPYMRATSIAAGALASVAQFFGYSAPPVIDPVSSIRFAPSANLCSPQIPTQIEKIALDPKNELTVDSRTVGLDGVDEMSIQHILNRDVFVGVFDWPATSTYDTMLGGFYVSPSYSMLDFHSGAFTGRVYAQVQQTPSCMLSQMFEYWTATDFHYHFKVAASKFHRGRIKFTWDPNGPWSISPNALLHQTIWDISESPEFDLVLPYQAATPYLVNDYSTSTASASGSELIVSGTSWPSLAYDRRYYNGAVKMEVLNELTSPAGGTVQIFMFFNGKNVRFSSPNDTASSSQYVFSIPQSDDDVVPGGEVVSTIPVAPTHEDVKHAVFMGEAPVASIRTIMQRSSYWDRLTPNWTPSVKLLGGAGLETFGASMKSALYTYLIPRIPIPAHITAYPVAPNFTPLDGSYPWSAFSSIAAGTMYIGSASHTLNMTILSSCYTLQRGSISWRGFLEYATTNNGALQGYTELSNCEIAPARIHWGVLRPTVTTSLASNLIENNNVMSGGHLIQYCNFTNAATKAAFVVNSFRRRVYRAALSSGFLGVSRANFTHSSQIEAVLPHYSPYRGFPCNPLAYQKQLVGPFGTKMPVQTSDTFAFTSEIKFANGAGIEDIVTNFMPSVDLYACAGPDYTLFKFLAVPTLFRYVGGEVLYPNLSTDQYSQS